MRRLQNEIHRPYGWVGFSLAGPAAPVVARDCQSHPAATDAGNLPGGSMIQPAFTYQLPVYRALSPAEKLILRFIYDCTDGDECFYGSLKKIWTTLALDRKTVLTAIKKLREKGLFAGWKNNGRGRRNEYLLLTEKQSQSTGLVPMDGTSPNLGTKVVPKYGTPYHKEHKPRQKASAISITSAKEGQSDKMLPPPPIATGGTTDGYREAVKQWFQDSTEIYWATLGKRYAGVDVIAEGERALAWLKRNAEKTRRTDIHRFLVNWFKKASA